MRSIAIALGIAAALAPVAQAGRADVSIMQIQGAGHTSPLAADTVATTGVVTSLSPDGFYLQDPLGDGDDATSDAVFVFTGPAVTVSIGDAVRAEGVVREFLPGGAAENLTVTEIHRPVVRVLATAAALPAPVLLGPGGRAAPPRVIDDDGLADYQPGEDGIDFYESLEGMRVRVVSPRVVQHTNAFGEVWVVPGDGHALSARGAIAAGPGDDHPARVQLDDALFEGRMPALEGGDRLADVTAVVSYRFGNYEMLAPSPPVRVSGGLSREIDALPRGGNRLRVASFNARNLGPDDGEERFDEIARIIVSHLGAPEIVALQEIEDDSGPENDGVVDATATLGLLVSAIRRADGPVYDFREVAPANGADGGAPGGNIRVAFLFDPRHVTFVDRGDSFGTAETRVVEAGGVPRLTRSPGRIAPSHPAWVQSRKPLAGEFRSGDATWFVVVAHFTSRSRATPGFGAVQPPADPDAGRRRTQAQLVAAFAAELLAIDPRARVVVAGDLNDDWFSETLRALEAAPLVNLAARLPERERYSLLFDGRAQLFDHILVSGALEAGAAADVVHVAAEFSRGVSDHDPVVASVSRREGASARPSRLLSLPRPNPFTATVEVDVRAPVGGSVEAAIYDVIGRRVRSLRIVSGTARWDGRDDAGRPVPAGLYWVRVSVDGANDARKVLRIRAP